MGTCKPIGNTLLPLECFCVRFSKGSEEIKQQNSELSEKLRSVVSENSAMKLDVEDLHKKLEMAELMIQQVITLLGCGSRSH